MKKIFQNTLIAALGVWSLIIFPAFGQSAGDYDLSWNTIDGGGGTSKGEPFELTGTIGQPDAGMMSGGNYILNGGFLAAGGTNEIWYVDDNAPNDPGPYNPDISDPYENGSPLHPFDRIQEAINAAYEDDWVVVAEGTYRESINFNGKAITLTGTAPNDWNVVKATIIDANNTGIAVTFDTNEDTSSILTGFKINGGTNGIRCAHCGPVISRCIIEKSDYGVGCYSNSSPSITNNVIRGNYIGIYSFGASPIIKNNLIYENAQGVRTNLGGSAVLRNNTIVNNTTYGIKKNLNFGTMTNSNCIVWNNGDDLVDCSAKYSCIKGSFDSNDPNYIGSINSDPCFVDEDANDFHLLSTSPCIDIGDPNGSYTGEFDIDLEDRVIDGNEDLSSIVDMGADEYWP